MKGIAWSMYPPGNTLPHPHPVLEIYRDTLSYQITLRLRTTALETNYGTTYKISESSFVGLDTDEIFEEISKFLQKMSDEISSFFPGLVDQYAFEKAIFEIHEQLKVSLQNWSEPVLKIGQEWNQLSQEPPKFGFQEYGDVWGRPESEFFQTFPCLKTKVVCPECFPEWTGFIAEDFEGQEVLTSLENVVIELNDTHRWTREAIADYIRLLDAAGWIDSKANLDA